METVADTVISTVAVRAMGPDYTTIEAGDMTKVKLGTGVRAEFKGSHPTTPIPKIVRGSSAANRTTSMEVGQDDQPGRGGRFGKDEKQYSNNRIFFKDNILVVLATILIIHSLRGLAKIQVTHSHEA